MENVSHDRLQQMCWMYLWNMYPVTRYTMWHTENEKPRLPGESKRAHMIRVQQAKAKGVLKGVWDLVFYWNTCLHIFDVKVGNDTLSDEQILFRDCIINQGGKAYEINDFETFKNIVDGIQAESGNYPRTGINT